MKNDPTKEAADDGRHREKKNRECSSFYFKRNNKYTTWSLDPKLVPFLKTGAIVPFQTTTVEFVAQVDSACIESRETVFSSHVTTAVRRWHVDGQVSGIAFA